MTNDLTVKELRQFADDLGIDINTAIAIVEKMDAVEVQWTCFCGYESYHEPVDNAHWDPVGNSCYAIPNKQYVITPSSNYDF